MVRLSGSIWTSPFQFVASIFGLFSFVLFSMSHDDVFRLGFPSFLDESHYFPHFCRASSRWLGSVAFSSPFFLHSIPAPLEFHSSWFSPIRSICPPLSGCFKGVRDSCAWRFLQVRFIILSDSLGSLMIECGGFGTLIPVFFRSTFLNSPLFLHYTLSGFSNGFCPCSTCYGSLSRRLGAFFVTIDCDDFFFFAC